jgi:hypothetical protein
VRFPKKSFTNDSLRGPIIGDKPDIGTISNGMPFFLASCIKTLPAMESSVTISFLAHPFQGSTFE